MLFFLDYKCFEKSYCTANFSDRLKTVASQFDSYKSAARISQDKY